jgi:hypothetical protein
VEPGSPAALAGVRAGWALNRVDTMTAPKMLKRAETARARYPLKTIAGVVAQTYLRGDPGSSVNVEFLNERDALVQKRSCAARIPGRP